MKEIILPYHSSKKPRSLLSLQSSFVAFSFGFSLHLYFIQARVLAGAVWHVHSVLEQVREMPWNEV